MPKIKSRLNVPGFLFGVKTGKFIDVAKLYGGRPCGKQSARPHTLEELQDSETISRRRKTIRLITQVSTEDYNRRKRTRKRVEKQAINTAPAIRACTKRFLEHMGKKCAFLEFVEKPELFISKAKRAYEITDGFCSILTTTSAREAMIICATLARYGIAAYFNPVKIPY